MRHWRQFARKISGFWQRGKSERALEKEMAAHFALLEADFCRQGMTAEEAKFAARRAFGGVEQAKEQYRDQRSFIFLVILRQVELGGGKRV